MPQQHVQVPEAEDVQEQQFLQISKPQGVLALAELDDAFRDVPVENLLPFRLVLVGVVLVDRIQLGIRHGLFLVHEVVGPPSGRRQSSLWKAALHP